MTKQYTDWLNDGSYRIESAQEISDYLNDWLGWNSTQYSERGW